MLLKWNVEHTSSSFLLFKLTDSLLFLYFSCYINSNCRSFNLISSLWLSDIHTINIVLFSFKSFSFWLRKFNIENKFTGKLLDLIEVFKLKSTDLNEFQVIFIEPLIDDLFFIGR